MTNNWNERWDALADRLAQMTLERYPEMATYLAYTPTTITYTTTPRPHALRRFAPFTVF
jgi:hypothetical protein